MTTMQVKPGKNGNWVALEDGMKLSESFASFADKADAVEYARSIASTTGNGKVEVFDKDGELLQIIETTS